MFLGEAAEVMMAEAPNQAPETAQRAALMPIGVLCLLHGLHTLNEL